MSQYRVPIDVLGAAGGFDMDGFMRRCGASWEGGATQMDHFVC
jgi:hypothetical protein